MITIQKLDEWGACAREDGERYSDANLKRLFRGRESLTPLEVERMRSVLVEDRIWVLLRPEVLGDRFQPVVYAIADRAVRRHCLTCNIPAVEEWAVNWLSGENRSYGAAAWAAEAAWAATSAAARAARNAAREASAAAREASAASAAERRAQLAIIRKALREG